MRTLRPDRTGYTLVELVLVVFIISMVLAIALPRLLPLIAFSQLEASARHVAGFGRAAIAECAMSGDRFTVRIDLDNQQYWAVRWLSEDADLFSDSDEEETDQEQMDQEALMQHIAELSTDDMDVVSRQIQERFDRFVQASIQARARNVDQEGILSGVADDMFTEFRLDADDEEDKSEEVKSALLTRTILPEGVRIETVQIGNAGKTSGVAEVEVTPMGLNEFVYFYLKNENDEYYTVVWDAVTGDSRLYEGKETPE
jgi:prepilin-type N-terminal cleavage/methylation domain-containing protein